MTTIGIRDDRYDASVPTVTSAVKRKKSVHGDSMRFLRPHAAKQLKFTRSTAMEFIDPARLIVCTNCGLAPLPRSIAEQKLHALGAGAEIIRKELAGKK